MMIKKIIKQIWNAINRFIAPKKYIDEKISNAITEVLRELFKFDYLRKDVDLYLSKDIVFIKPEVSAIIRQVLTGPICFRFTDV